MRIGVTHGIDIDGIVSGILLERALGNIDVVHTDYPELVNTLQSLPKGEIHVADLSPTGKRSTFVDVVTRLQPYAWYDHHNWEGAENAIPAITHPYIRAHTNAASIIQDVYSLHKPHEQQLAHLGYVSDHQVREDSEYETATRIQHAITAANNGLASLEEIISHLRTTTHIHGAIHDAERAYHKKHLQATTQLQKTAVQKTIEGVTYVAGVADNILYMKEGLRALRAKGDVVITAFPNNAVIAKGDKVDVVAWARKNQGGGRNDSAGFIQDEPATPEELIEQASAYRKPEI